MDYDYLEDVITKELRSHISRVLMSIPYERVSKKVDLSVKARELGNKMFREASHDAELHEKILHCYSASLALAPNDSENICLAYGNKSALLLHLRKFEDCVKDIDRALKLAVMPNALRIKLLCRKIECFVAMGKLDGRQEMLQEIDNYLGMTAANEDNKALETMVDRAKTLMNTRQAEVSNKDYETEHLRVRAQKESKGIFDSISLTRDNKYGHHLIATQDIQPGQLVFVSSPYVAVTGMNNFKSYCAHCINVLWSSVPCDNCCFSLYCSEQCRDKASSYHKLECLCLQSILCDGLVDYHVHIALRSVILAVNEFGSIEGLIKMVRGVDHLSNDNAKGFNDNGTFYNDSFKSLLKFTNIKVGPSVLKLLTEGSCRSVIALSKYTSFFGDNQHFETVQDLLGNPNVLFIASLLLRISMIAFKKGSKIGEGSTACKNGKDQVTCSSGVPCCERGYAINTMNSFIPHSCNPNVRSVITDEGKELWYALQPIRKGQILFDCYKATFFEMDKPLRSSLIAQFMNRNCDCIACEQNWPAVLAPGGRIMTYQDMSHMIVEGIKNKNVCGKFLIMIGENERYTQTTVNDLIKIMSAIFETENQPSKLLCSMICILRFVFDRLHGIKLRMPSECRFLPIN